MGYWLMKSEPDVYSIDDLERAGTEHWEGIRNYQARNFIRDLMQIGDKAFFYNSNSDPSGIIGLMEVVSDPYPDPTQFDPKSAYFDPKSPADNPRWLVRDVRFVRKFARVIPLSELKVTPGLEQMKVVQKGMRLSVMPVTEQEWEIVLSLPGI